ncbi:hypothetical protein JCM31826_19960 [Thermaurantimonas aggregans]|uniref:Uncharacterized protein n=1 Tax=Thermaurantimonas aggregans TaxID=2173829 RepID=A0A401XNC0_9FLAO|nr:hypothetical protein [Thermaurantimonas aggregans]MCX8149632.1 hypothetical protein [Thermaurantimonas aggregans]GCD78514.1 hypothetical protein JCM31826_19960 [Thermaurantimonas aggregans]
MRKIPTILVVLFVLWNIKLSNAQIFSYSYNPPSQYNFKSIFFINDHEFIVRNNEKVSKFNLNSPNPFIEKYAFDGTLLNKLLHLDEKYIITTTAIYQHNYFKDLKKVADLTIILRTKKDKDPFEHQKFLFHKSKNVFIVSDSKDRIIYIVNPDDGTTEIIKLPIEKGDEVFPLTHEYVYVKKKYNKKKGGRSYIILNYRTNEAINTVNFTPLLTVSDTLAFVSKERYYFINIKTGELLDWVSTFTNPNIPCCDHHLSQNGQYIISRGGTLTYSVYDIKKKKILTSSEFNSRTEYLNVYDSRMRNIIYDDMYYPFDDIEVSPDGKKYIYSEQNGWVLVASTDDYSKIFQYGKYYPNSNLKRKQQASGSQNQGRSSASVPSGVRELNLNFQSEYQYQWFNNTGTYKEMQVKIVVTPTTIQEYIWGKGAYVEWGGPCTIVHSKNETIANKTGLLYVCSSGKKYFFYSDKGINAVRVETSQNNVFDYLHDLPK